MGKGKWITIAILGGFNLLSSSFLYKAIGLIAIIIILTVFTGNKHKAIKR